jgi:hypothetical protein
MDAGKLNPNKDVRTSGYIQRVEASTTDDAVSKGRSGKLEVGTLDIKPPIDQATWDAADKAFKSDSINATVAGEWWKVNAQDYKRLLGQVLDAIDASLPNKQQHTAATRMVRNAFDKTYYEMMRLTHPDCAFGGTDCYAVEPIR